MKDLGKSSLDIVPGESEHESESEAHAAHVPHATFNLSLGSSGSLFAATVSSDTNPNLTLTQTLTQTQSQTMRHLSPRQSPRQSPKQEIEVIEIFESESERLAASQQVAVVHQHPRGTAESQHKRRERDANNGSATGHVTESDATMRFMDKHLCELEQEDLAAGICDIAAYMANLREKAFEPADAGEEAADQQQNDSSLSPEPQTIVENTQQIVTVDIESPSSRPATESDSTGGNTTGPSERSGDETEDEPTSSLASHIVVIDKKVDKVFKAKSPERATAAAGAKPKSGKRQSIYISPDRCKSQGSSPVRIIKIKSPRNSVSDQGKRLSICSSRENSQDRLSGGRRTPSPRRSSEGGGGILKHTSPGAGILKPPASPAKSKSPDRSCLKKGGASHVCAMEPTTTTLSPRISPRGSVDHLSPDRASICQRHSPRSSFDSHGGSDHNLDVPYGGSGGSRKRSMSAHGSFETGNKPHAQETYQYYPVYDNQTCSDHYVAAAPTTSRYGSGNGRSRLSKSLERSTSRDSTTTSSSYRPYGVSPERNYVVYSSGPLRSQSAENTFSQPIYDALPRQAPQQYMPMVSYMQDMDMGYGQPPPPSCPHDPAQQAVYQLSSSAPEYTTCIDCLYQKRPS